MKRILGLVVAIAMTACLSDATAQAQGYQDGYRFGAGVRAHHYNDGINGRINGRFDGGINRRLLSRYELEQPPYFAKYPPVYYSHVVKRPYGISPYAAPAGIAPVEMSFGIPISVKNPFFGNDIEPVSEKIETSVEEVDSADESTDQKTTWIPNPYVVGGDISIASNR